MVLAEVTGGGSSAGIALSVAFAMESVGVSLGFDIFGGAGFYEVSVGCGSGNDNGNNGEYLQLRLRFVLVVWTVIVGGVWL